MFRAERIRQNSFALLAVREFTSEQGEQEANRLNKTQDNSIGRRDQQDLH